MYFSGSCFGLVNNSSLRFSKSQSKYLVDSRFGLKRIVLQFFYIYKKYTNAILGNFRFSTINFRKKTCVK